MLQGSFNRSQLSAFKGVSGWKIWTYLSIKCLSVQKMRNFCRTILCPLWQWPKIQRCSPTSYHWWSSSPGTNPLKNKKLLTSHCFSRISAWCSTSSSSTPSFPHKYQEDWNRKFWRKYSPSATSGNFSPVSCFWWACFSSAQGKWVFQIYF